MNLHGIYKLELECHCVDLCHDGVGACVDASDDVGNCVGASDDENDDARGYIGVSDGWWWCPWHTNILWINQRPFIKCGCIGIGSTTGYTCVMMCFDHYFLFVFNNLELFILST